MSLQRQETNLELLCFSTKNRVLALHPHLFLQLSAVFSFPWFPWAHFVTQQGTVLRQVVPVPTVARFRTLCGLQFSYPEYLVTCGNAPKQIVRSLECDRCAGLIVTYDKWYIYIYICHQPSVCLFHNFESGMKSCSTQWFRPTGHLKQV